MKGFFVVSWLFAVGIVGAIAQFGPFPWFGYAAVAWFAGFLGVVLVGVYALGRMLGRFPTGGGGSGGGSQRQRSKGARER